VKLRKLRAWLGRAEDSTGGGKLRSARFRVFNAEVRFTSIIITLVGALLMVVVDHELVTNLGATLLTIGVIGVTYDAYLKRTFTDEAMAVAGAYLKESFTKELLETLNIDQALAQSGIREVAVGAQIDWAQVHRGAARVSCFLINPQWWLELHWPLLLEHVRVASASIEIFCPDPEGPYIRDVADRFDIPRSLLEEQCREARRRVEQEWLNVRQSARPPVTGTQVRMKWYTDIPAFEVVSGDESAVLRIRGSLGDRTGDDVLVLRVGASPPTPASQWVEQQLDRVRGLNDTYYDHV
jgi:hypothetical protein